MGDDFEASAEIGGKVHAFVQDPHDPDLLSTNPESDPVTWRTYLPVLGRNGAKMEKADSRLEAAFSFHSKSSRIVLQGQES
jgi:hypothetical protein